MTPANRNFATARQADNEVARNTCNDSHVAARKLNGKQKTCFESLLPSKKVMTKFNRLELKRLLSRSLGKRINQNDVEKWSSSFWHVASSEPKVGQPFVMLFPPPNITGNLHLGHALTAVLQDALVRQRKMSGQSTVWIPGFDHAGLATQSIVERLLYNKHGQTRHQYGRDNFIHMADEWKDLKRDEMRNQLNRLGLSLDYDREYFTMDDRSSQAVHSAFKQLFNSGFIYRDKKSVYWSNELQTTLSDIEVETVGGTDCYFRTGETVQKKEISQWFISAHDMAHKSVDVVNNGSINIIPPNYKNSWSAWLCDNGVRDWCISRQSWWGHRIPVYRLKFKDDSRENWVVADSRSEAEDKLGSKDIIQDSDVLDTWFSSSLLPLTVSGWPDEDTFSKNCKQGFFPLHIMETGFDILNYWVSKMVMMSLALTGKVPFNLVLLHGMICDHEGKKMSKSKGNVIDPLDLIDGINLSDLQHRARESCAQGIIDEQNLEYILENQKKLFPRGIPNCGSDGLRAYLLSHDFQEEVVRISIAQIEKVRRLSNKIWNVYRYILSIMNVSKNKISLDSNLNSLDYEKLDESDQQVLKHLARCVEISQETFGEDYQIHRAFNALELFWNVQLSSDFLQTNRNSLLDTENSHRKQQIILLCITTATKLMHPFMPHLTEFLHQKLLSELGDQYMQKPLIEEHFPSVSDWSRFIVPREKLQETSSDRGD